MGEGRSLDLSTQDGDLVAQRDDLDVLRPARADGEAREINDGTVEAALHAVQDRHGVCAVKSYVRDLGTRGVDEDAVDLQVEHLRGIPAPIAFSDLGRCRHSDTRVIDPVCGMELAPSFAVEVTTDGHTAWFCSTGCVERWSPRPAEG